MRYVLSYLFDAALFFIVFLLGVLVGATECHAQVVPNWDQSPYNWKNSEYNIDNSQTDWRNNPYNWQNSQYNYSNKSGIYDVQGNWAGYGLRNTDDRLNIFTPDGERDYYNAR